MLRISFIFLLTLPALALDDLPRMYVEDGQMKNHYFRVFVENANLSKSRNKPLISIQISDPFRGKTSLAADDSQKGAFYNKGPDVPWFVPVEVYPNSTYSVERNGIEATIQGTLMIFDLNQNEIILPIQPNSRIFPELSWIVYDEADSEKFTSYHLTTDPVYLGSRFAAFLWSLIPILLTILAVVIFSKRLGKSSLGVLKGANGLYSLSRTQISLWTLAIGSMIATYGLTQLAVPVIPSTLVVMMGLSLATSTTQGVKDNASDSKKTAEEKAASDPPQSKGFADMIYDPSTKSISLPKAQMMFWTVVSIGLFFYKSMMEGHLWEMPPELVTLMGASQTGYLLKDLGVKNNNQAADQNNSDNSSGGKQGGGKQGGGKQGDN